MEDVGDAKGHLDYGLEPDTHTLMPALRRPDRATVHPVLPLDSAHTRGSLLGHLLQFWTWRSGLRVIVHLHTLPPPLCTMRCPCRAALTASGCSAPVPAQWAWSATPGCCAMAGTEASEASCTAASPRTHCTSTLLRTAALLT